MAEHNNFYQYVTYYDLVFDRDVSREVDFVTAAFNHHAGRSLQAVLEIACGPGYHARAFARRGLRAVGLDLNSAMIALAREKDAAEGLAVTWLRADMRHFQLDFPVDVAFCIFDGIDALLSNEDIVQHLRIVAHNLTPAGLYIIDLTHPRDCLYNYYPPFVYSGERNGVSVGIRWATNNPKFDLMTGVAYVELEMRVNENGRELVIRDSAYERLLLPQEICLLVELSGAFRIVGWYGDFDLNQPLDDSPASRRMIVVLQKVGGELNHV